MWHRDVRCKKSLPVVHAGTSNFRPKTSSSIADFTTTNSGQNSAVAHLTEGKCECCNKMVTPAMVDRAKFLAANMKDKKYADECKEHRLAHYSQLPGVGSLLLLEPNQYGRLEYIHSHNRLSYGVDMGLMW